MAKKGGDPFNFDDVYSQIGADDFIKKSMAELKSTQAHQHAAAPPRPGAFAETCRKGRGRASLVL